MQKQSFITQYNAISFSQKVSFIILEFKLLLSLDI